MSLFTTGFVFMNRILLLLAGVVCAVLETVLVVAIMLAAGAWLFDLVTNAMVRRWRKRGSNPRGKLARILMGHADNGKV